MASMQVVEQAAKKECRKMKQWQNGTVASITNQTQTWLSLDRCKNWAGIPATGSFPSTISRNGTARFTHLRGGQYGSVAAVQYSGTNTTNFKCAWIVAWQAPVEDTPPCPPNRVYVACGPKTMMDAITWNEIIMKLDTSPTYDCDSDSSTKTSVEANIHDSTAGTATLCVNFKLTP